MRRSILCLAAWTLAVFFSGVVSADSITLVSDGSTLATALGPGAPSSSTEAILDSGDTTGLTFAPALVGSYGTFTSVPTGAPASTDVINIPPGDGENGFFEVSFTLPAGFFNPSLSGAGNVDDAGTVFLNGNAITSVNYLDEYDSNTFSTSNASFFQAGTNILLISDSNLSGGPSGAAFYANVLFNGSAVPEPSSLTLLGFGIAAAGAYAWRRKRAAA